MKNDRLFQMVYLLMERRAMTALELARLLEVSVRTVYRDVEALSMAGVPICATVGKGGGIALMPGYAFDRALLSDDEQNQILFAIQSLRAVEQPVDGLLSKLGSVFHKTDTNWIEVDFSRWGFRRTDAAKFELLKKSILEKRVLHFCYFGTSGMKSERDVKPVKLIFKDKSWYMQAFCLFAQAFRLFKINRMEELALLETRFADLFSSVPPLECGTPPSHHMLELSLRFSSAVAFRVYDEFESGSITHEPDGSLLVKAVFPEDGWVYSYLFSFGTQVELLEPEKLRAELAVYAEKVVRHHRS